MGKTASGETSSEQAEAEVSGQTLAILVRLQEEAQQSARLLAERLQGLGGLQMLHPLRMAGMSPVLEKMQKSLESARIALHERPLESLTMVSLPPSPQTLLVQGQRALVETAETTNLALQSVVRQLQWQTRLTVAVLALAAISILSAWVVPVFLL